MKITKRQLRRLIKEEVVHVLFEGRNMLSEGSFWASVKQNLKDIVDPTGTYFGGAGMGVDEQYLKEMATTDAWMLFKALAGWGTDEDTITAILDRRSGDLLGLSTEFDELRHELASQRRETHNKILQSVLGDVQDYQNIMKFQDQPLSVWLYNDGMEDEAMAVAAVTGDRIVRL